MAIRQYQDEHGITKFLCNVVVKSKSEYGIRVQKQRKGFSTRAEACRVERQLKTQAVRDLVEKESLGHTWGAIVRSWEEGIARGDFYSMRPLHRTTIEDYSTAIRLYTSDWTKTPIEHLSRKNVLDVLNLPELCSKSMSRKRIILKAINHVFNWALEAGVIKKSLVSPAYKVRVNFREEEKKPEILSLVQIKRLLELSQEHSPEWHPVWATALLTGLRSGELHELRWSDIDWENKRVTVARSYNRRIRKVTATKGRYWREVPINEDLESLLKDLRAASRDHIYVLPRIPAWERGEAAVFLRSFCLGMGLPSIKFHTLRACFATQLIANGIAPAIVMRIAGWRDLRTMQRYIRLAGVEIAGATDSMKIVPHRKVMAMVVDLYGSRSRQ